MQTSKQYLFEEIFRLAKDIKQEFKKKGLVLPSHDKTGAIKIGNFSIVKEDNAYLIKDARGEVVAGPINLAQTAVLTANDLALGKWPDSDLLNNDKWYGYKDFDEQAAKVSATRALKQHDVDKADYSLSKAAIAHDQKLYYKRSIDSRFNKLRRLA